MNVAVAHVARAEFWIEQVSLERENRSGVDAVVPGKAGEAWTLVGGRGGPKKRDIEREKAARSQT